MLKLAPALITGNTVIAKPAPTTPLTTLLLVEIAAGILPAGVFQTVVDDHDLDALLTGHSGIAYVSFTGSTTTGRKMLPDASHTLKRGNFEHRGNDVAIVLDDADIDVVVPAIFRSAMLNAGQNCFATKRVYVPHTMINAICKSLIKLANDAVVGDGLIPGTAIGPVQNAEQYDRVLALIEEARVDGMIVAGDRAVAGRGYFIAPTIVRDLDETAPLLRDEQSGPVLFVLAYDNIDELVLRTNRGGYQPELGRPWLIVGRVPVYVPWALFGWWYSFDAYAPHVFDKAGMLAGASGFLSCGAAVAGSLWRARQRSDVTTYGSARWANAREIDQAGLHRDAGVLLGRIGGRSPTTRLGAITQAAARCPPSSSDCRAHTARGRPWRRVRHAGHQGKGGLIRWSSNEASSAMDAPPSRKRPISAQDNCGMIGSAPRVSKRETGG